MKKFVHFIITYTLITLIIVVFLNIFLDETQVFQYLKKVNLKICIEQIFLTLLFGLINYNLQNQILRSFDIKLRSIEWIGLGFVNTMMNYILPFKSGTGIKALFLRNKYNFKISHCLSIMIYVHFSLFKILILLATITFLFLKSQNNLTIPHINIYLFISIVGFITTLFIPKLIKYLSISSNSPHHKFPQRIQKITTLLIDGMFKLSQNKKLNFIITFSNLLLILTQSLRLFTAYNFISQNVTFINTMFINILYCLSSFINLTPGNLGLQEIIISLSSTLINITKEEGLVVSGLIRSASLIVIFSFGPIFYFLLKINKFIFDSEEAKCKH